MVRPLSMGPGLGSSITGSLSRRAGIMQRLLIVAIFAGCANAIPRGCAQPKATVPAPEASTTQKTLDVGIPTTEGEFGLETLEGRHATLWDYRARVTLLAFWATWCHPCLDELPYVEMLHQLYKDDRDVSIVAVSIDTPSALELVKAQVAELKLTFPVVRDPERKLINQFIEQIQIPLLVFIDRDFKEYREVGFSKVFGDDFLATHQKLIELARTGSLPNEPPRPRAFGTMPPAN